MNSTTAVTGPAGNAESAPTEFESREPATGTVLASFPQMDAALVGTAVTAARAAGKHWATIDFRDRKRALLAWAGELSRCSDDLVDLIHQENGKPADDAYLELVLALEHIGWAARNAQRVLAPRSVSPGILMSNFSARVENRPYGVVAVISPWNYPVFAPIAPVASALAAGNTVVLKPSEYATATARALVDAFHRANPGLDHGVLDLVTGLADTGAALIDAGIDKLEFTGSPRVGRIVGQACAARFIPAVMECGGKDALIVAADADIEAAADAAAWGGMSNGGQTCVGIERIYVDRRVSAEFLSALNARLADVRVGDHPHSAYGPMTLPQQCATVARHIEAAVASGASTPLGGVERVRGRWIDPVLLVDGDETCAAVQEETFGPTLTVRRVDSIDEAVTLANASDFGLGAAVFSQRDGRRIARRLRSGMVSINSVLAFVSIPGLPFGGIGASGYGRIHGAEGLREFSRPHSLAEKRFEIPGMNGMLLDRSPLTMPTLRLLTRLRFSFQKGGIR